MIPGVVHRNGHVINPHGQSVAVPFDWNFWISLFNCCSAFTDTGLVAGSLGSDYSLIGQLIVMVLIQVGGVGVMTIKTLIWIAFKREPSYRGLVIVNEERGDINPSQIKKIIKSNLGFLLVAEGIGAFCLFFVFYFTHPEGQLPHNPHHNATRAMWMAVFSSVSAINNAGFDIIAGSNSFVSYAHNYYLQVIMIIEFVIGGLGFITLSDLKNKFRRRQDRQPLSLFSKINLVVYLLVAVSGVGGVWAIEGFNRSRLPATTNGDLFMQVFFNTMSTRNAGFATVNPDLFNNGSKLIHIIMMFVGAAPSSTAGGIRTTTFGVLILTFWATIRRREVSGFKRTIDNVTVRQASMVFLVSVLLLGLGSFLSVNFVDQQFKAVGGLNWLYMLTSAFGTVGLNPVPNAIFNPHTAFQIMVLLNVIVLMFIGQLGVNNVLLMSRNSAPGQRYPTQRVKIG